MRVFALMADLADACTAEGAYVVFDWPRRCHYWRRPEVAQVLARFSLRSVVVNGCAVGLVKPGGGGAFIARLWRLATNAPSLITALGGLRCSSDGGHSHVPDLDLRRGPEAENARGYPRLLRDKK